MSYNPVDRGSDSVEEVGSDFAVAEEDSEPTEPGDGDSGSGDGGVRASLTTEQAASMARLQGVLEEAATCNRNRRR